MAGESINNTPCMQDPERRTPIELFTSTKVSSNPNHWKPFGCPAYVLDNNLQSRRPFHKWKLRAKLGVYLGSSPQHGRNVAPCPAPVSPQHHVAFDSSFDTVRKTTMHADWLLRTGFRTQREARGKEDRIQYPDVSSLMTSAEPSPSTRTDASRQQQPTNQQQKKTRAK